MGQKPDAKLTPEIARELCQRTGSAAFLDGSIAQIGTQYLLTVKAVSCVSDQSLASTEAQASDKNHVLDALGKAASEIRNKLGESLSTVQKFDTPLEQATTPSLEALKAYSLGHKALDEKGDNDAAESLFQRAIRLDPSFAMAYASLGTSYLIRGRPTLASEPTKKAYELRERVSEWEKFYIESQYHWNVTGNWEKARQVYELWAQTYPRDAAPHMNLAGIYAALGQHERGLEQSLESHRLNANALSYYILVRSYISLNRLGEAQATITEAQAKKLDSGELHIQLYRIAFLQNDVAGMTQQADWAAGREWGTQQWMLLYEALTPAYFGQFKKARELSRQGLALAEQAKDNAAAADAQGEEAYMEAVIGNAAEARHQAAAALAHSTDRYRQCYAAYVLALAGDVPRAQGVADDLAKRFPEDSSLQSICLPMIHAELALNRNDASKAIDLLQQAITLYRMGLSPAYLRGEAYLAAHQGNEAVGEFQKILDHRWLVEGNPIGALAHLQIGRAYAMQGDTAKAKAAYQDFLTLWKDADPDIPVLIAAKAEYAKLQ